MTMSTLAILLDKWHSAASVHGVALQNPPGKDEIDAIASTYNLLANDPILEYFAKFCAEQAMLDEYLQYNGQMFKVNEELADKDYWVPNTLVQISPRESVFYLDPRGGCSTFKRVNDDNVQISLYEHEDSTVEVYSDFVSWLDELISTLLLSLEFDQDTGPWWKFWK